MPRCRTPSKQARIALLVLAERPFDWQHGYDLMRRAGLASGTLYPILMRLCDQRLLEAEWVGAPQQGRPPRHAYRLTPAGLQFARDLRDTENADGGALKGLAT